ncbi:alanine racemase [Rubritalea halochordaticola]|uniref:Alanine racemase n=1 Tax=Rubritalea halochordaticola TaxID=714537 RepID=A0ABP9UXD4_9BACT
MKSIQSPPRTWAEINLSALKQNLKLARERSGQRVMAVLKAGAYGHGLEQIAKALDSEGLPFFGVASVIEARRLAAIGIQTRIYLLGPTFPDERAEAVYHRWVISISTKEEADHVNTLNQGNDPLPVHITLDTGMGRGGFLPDQLTEGLAHIKSLPNLTVEGIGSHLPSADEDKAFTLAQFKTFESAFDPSEFQYIHIANSAGLLDYSSKITNMVRPGLMLYGISPLLEYQDELIPVMTLKSRVSLIRTLPKGHGISYGRETILERDTRVATIGAGYGDGYPRSLSSKGTEVIIRGKRCKLLGRVTMDQIMVDVTDLPDCETGDEVELFGPELLVSEIAQKAGTIAWEILTGITPRVTRIYL